MTQPAIRTMQPDELPALLELYTHLHDDDEPLPMERAQAIWEKLLADPNIRCLGAEVDGRVVASCILSMTPNLTRGGRPYGLIENVVTHADYRKRGIGTAMLRHALSMAWEAGCYKVMLLTGRKSEAVYRFYQNAGFVRGEKEGFVARVPR